MDNAYDKVHLKVSMNSQYHIGSGFGLGRIIDSLLKVDTDGIPFIPGSTISGLIAQGMYDLLHFRYFDTQRGQICRFHDHDADDPKLPCALLKKREDDFCLLCYFFGSTAKGGVAQFEDMKCTTDQNLMPHLFTNEKMVPEEREQYIKPYVSHKQDMRSGIVLEKHFFSQEEGAALTFEGTVIFNTPVPSSKSAFLAAALKNVRAVGRRKSRGKGACLCEGRFENSRQNLTITCSEILHKI